MLNESAVHKAKLGKCWEPGGGVLFIAGFTGRLRPKGVPFVSLQYIKGQGKLPFSYMKGSQNQQQSGRNGG